MVSEVVVGEHVRDGVARRERPAPRAEPGLRGQPGQQDRYGQTVRLSGRVDVRSVGELRSRLHSAIETGSGLLRVDVAGLELADHAGLGVLLGSARRARRFGRSMVLVDVPIALSKLLAAHRLNLALRVEDPADLAHLGHA